MKICRVCEIEFDENCLRKKRLGGLIDVCPDCIEDGAVDSDVAKSLGVINGGRNKVSSVAIVRNPSAATAAQIRFQGLCGPGHCATAIGLRSTGNDTAKHLIDKINESLENAKS
jgi:hypothetical protein